MDSQSIKPKRTAFLWLGCACIVTMLMSQASSAAQQTAAKATAATQAKPKTFDTPEQAAEALVKAAEAYDVASLNAILGPDGRTLIDTGEPARDKETATAFAAQARAKMKVLIDPRNRSLAILIGR